MEDGLLVCESGPDEEYGYLGTEKEYKDFELTLEFKQGADGNSGVFFRSSIEGTRITGWQVEVAPPGLHTGGIYESYGRGWLIKPCEKKEEFLNFGEWNTMKIRVVGDLAGFAAAICYRGLPYIQVPTSIVAQVDSSVGGKTGVNTAEGKNLVGAFHQPSLVIADTATLKSLPEREYREGFAEVIKHAAIRDGEMLPLIEPAASSRDDLAELIARNVAIKAAIVAEDERETSGTRALLCWISWACETHFSR